MTVASSLCEQFEYEKKMICSTAIEINLIEIEQMKC
jgi:hypothetical protein